jgi:Phage-related minor tail protein
MGVVSELTLLLGVEAQERVTDTFERVNAAIDNFGAHADAAGKASSIMGTEISSSFDSATVAQARLAASTDILTAATERMKVAQQALVDLSTSSNVYPAGEKTAAYTSALNELNSAEQAVTKATKDKAAADELAASKAETHTSALSGLESGLNNIGPKAAIAAAAIIGFGYVTANAATNYQSSVIQMQNSAGMTTKAANDLANAFLNTAGKSTYSATQLVQAFTPVAGQLATVEGHALSTAQALSFMEVATQASEASGQSLGGVTSSLAKIMQSYHLTVNQTAEAASALYQASSMTGTTISETATQVARMKQQMGSLAPSITDTSALLVDLTSHGQNGRSAMMALNTSLSNLLKTNNKVTPTQQEVAKSIAALPPQLQSLANAYSSGEISVTNFDKQVKNLTPENQKYMTSIKGLVDQSKEQASVLNALNYTPAQEELSHLGVSLTDASGKFVGIREMITRLQPALAALPPAEQAAAEKTLFGAGASKKLIDTIMAGPAVYDAYLKKVQDKQAMEEAAARASNTYKGSMEKVKSAIDDAKIEIGNAFLPILTQLMNSITSFIGPIMRFINTHKQLAKTILEVVLAITGGVAIIYTMQKATSVLSDTLGKNGLLGNVESASKAILKMFGYQELATGAEAEGAVATDTLAGGFLGLDVAMAPAIATIGAVVLAIAAVAIGAYELYKHWNTVWSFVKRIFGDVTKFLKTGLGDLVLALLGPIGAIIFLGLHWQETWKIIKEVATDAWHFLDNNVIHPIGDAFTWLYNDVLKPFVDLNVAAFEVFKQIFVDAYHAVDNDFIKPLAAIFTWLYNNVFKYFFDVVEVAFKLFVTAFALIAQGIWDFVVQPIWQFWSWLWNNLGPVFNGIVALFKTAWNVIYGVVSWVWGNIIVPIASFFNWLWNNGIAPALNAIWNGILGAWRVISSIVGWIQNNIINPIVSIFSTVSGAISWVFGGVYDAIVGPFKSAFNEISRVWNATIGGFHFGGFLGFGSFTVPTMPHLAAGGLLSANEIALVGEKGPELFVSSAAGRVLPNSSIASNLKTNGGAGGGDTIVNVTISGQVYGSLEEFANKLGQQLATQTLPSGGVVLTR